MEDKKNIIIRFRANKIKYGIVPWIGIDSYIGKIFINKYEYSIVKIESYLIGNP